MQQEQKQAARREREQSWSAFAARYGFELFKHAHEACYGARGRLDGLDLTVAEQLEGSELFAAHVLPEALELVPLRPGLLAVVPRSGTDPHSGRSR